MSAPTSVSNPTIRTLLLCDLVASTQLVERVGDATAADLLARHDRLARDLLAACNGREIDKSDGFLLLFERPIEAVRFAIGYQAKLRELGQSLGSPMVARVGIHLGEVVLRENAPDDVARGAKLVEVEGLAKAIAARVMSLAGDGRILLTRAAYDFARRAAVGMPDEAPLSWAAHGLYRLAGVEDPIEVCEVAANRAAAPGAAARGAAVTGVTALTPPPSSEKAQREGDAHVQPSTGRPTRLVTHDTDAPPAPPEPLLAVLAFDNLSTDPEMQFFSDGVSEDIIQRLARGANLKVIGRMSSFQFRGERKADAADQLKCSHVLDGSIRRAGGRVRVSASLVEAASRTTLWTDRYDRSLEDIFAVQDEISESIARALQQTFSSFSVRNVEPGDYDLYLRASPKSYAPDELRTCVGLLEVVTQRAPKFAEGWARLTFLRAFLHLYQPFRERAASAARVVRESEHALALDPDNVDALAAQYFSTPPFGRFAEAIALIERIRRSSAAGEGRKYIGYCLRTVGFIRESAEEAERAYQLDALDPMTENMTALARMAAGRVAEAVPLYADLIARIPDMNFPISSLLRSYALLEDWPAVDRLLAVTDPRKLREFQDGLAFIRTKRDPSPANIGAMRNAMAEHAKSTSSVDVVRLVYAAHLGLVDEAYAAAERARLGPRGAADDVMGPDGYRTSMLFQASMPQLRDDPRFVRLCARLGLVEFWTASGKWPDCADEVPYDFKAECSRALDVPKDEFGF